MLNKFALKAFNQFSFNRKVSRPLNASFLLDLPNYYFSKVVVKTININLLKTKFLLILSSQNCNQQEKIICVNDAQVRS